AEKGGFCSLWLPAGGGGCSTSGRPLSTGALLRLGVPEWITGDVISPAVSDVVIRFSDGSSLHPRIVWVSAPINAGFFAYDLPVAASVVFGGAILWLGLSLPVGILSALRPRSLVDRLAMVFVLIGVSAPAVWIGLILAYVFGFKLGWTPIADYCSFFPSHQIGVCSGPGQWAYHLVLPWLT